MKNKKNKNWGTTMSDINNSFFKTKVTYGLVCLANLEDIEKLNGYIARQPGIKPVYQKVSVKSLRILEEEA